MRAVNIYELPTENFSVSEVAAYRKVPSYRSLNSDGRLCNGFLLIEEGECVYEWDGKSAKLTPGSLIYLPLGSIHKMKVTTNEFVFIRVDFTLKDASGEILLLSECPLVIADDAGDLCTERIRELTRCFSKNADNFKCISLLCSLLSEICTKVRLESGQIAPAVNYINSNLLEKTEPETLAELCMMSRSKMYRLFKEETGTNPIDYRNRLRIEKAKLLLSSDEYTVGEIAALLGFESIYYFSRVFKQHCGVSPLKYEKM